MAHCMALAVSLNVCHVKLVISVTIKEPLYANYVPLILMQHALDPRNVYLRFRIITTLETCTQE